MILWYNVLENSSFPNMLQHNVHEVFLIFNKTLEILSIA